MDVRDLFVGSVALTIGLMMVYTSFLNVGWCFQMKIVRVIEESRGRKKARSFIGWTGTAMTLIGLYLLLAPWVASQWLQSSDWRNTNEAPAKRPIIANAD